MPTDDPDDPDDPGEADADAAAALRNEVRNFVRTEFARAGLVPHCDAWMSAFSPEFSRALGRQGWIGMTWPLAYGGHARSERDRLIVVEELLAAGAPVAAHWFADRQVGPALLSKGTERQRQEYLPWIAAGECFFSIGMSEPDSGSDLASIRTRAEPVGGPDQPVGWLLNGSKIWTSHAHQAHRMIALVRTSPADPQRRHAGLSQLIVDLHRPGVLVRPIVTLDGRHHFNEIVLTDVALDEGALLGREGAGWAQVTSELAYERSGPERYLSTFPLLADLARRHALPPQVLGELAAELQTLRALSRQVADALARAQVPTVEAALVKDLGSRFERKVVDAARQWDPVELDPDCDDPYTRLLTEAVQHGPDATLRGGTNEILRGIVARELLAGGGTNPAGSGTNPAGSSGGSSGGEVRRTITELALGAENHRPDGAWDPDAARRLVGDLRAGSWLGVGLPANLGGQDGDLADAAEVAAGLAYAAALSPVTDHLLVAIPLLAAAGVGLPDDALVLPVPGLGVRHDDGTVSVEADRVPWAGWAGLLVAIVADPAELAAPEAEQLDAEVVLLEPATPPTSSGRNLADEPRGPVTLSHVPPVARASVVGLTAETIPALGALTRAVQITAALERALDLTVGYCAQRHQFGRPLSALAVVQHELAALAGEVAATRAATRAAVVRLAGRPTGLPDEGALRAIAAAKVRGAMAATAGSRIAHQLHGAIGITREYELQRHTRSLWAWRDEYGSQTHWAGRLGGALSADPRVDLWAALTEF